MNDQHASLFVFDVDGTLLDSNLTIPPGTRAAVRELRAAGHHVALASGRPPRSVAELSEDLIGEVVAGVSLNGALVTLGEDVVAEDPVAPEAVGPLVERARAEGLEVNIYSGWSWLVEELGPGVSAEAETIGFGPLVVPDAVQAATAGAHKLLFMGDRARTEALLAWAVASEFSVFGWTHEGGPQPLSGGTKPTYCEIVAGHVAKSGAVVALAERLGLSAERVIAFGDAENDVKMLEIAGVAVAMGNAGPTVRGVADLVTASNDDEGIAKALAKLGYVSVAPDDL